MFLTLERLCPIIARISHSGGAPMPEIPPVAAFALLAVIALVLLYLIFHKKDDDQNVATSHPEETVDTGMTEP